MRSLFVLASLILHSCFVCGNLNQQIAKRVDAYVDSQRSFALSGLLANIGPDGAKAPGAKAGVAIASPCSENPDYFHTWINNGAIVFKVLIDQYIRGENPSLRQLIDSYFSSQSKLQQLPNKSGTVETGGLGEPRFHSNETVDNGPWGRPQLDGPALRATALMRYANWHLDGGNLMFIVKKMWPVLRLDLDFIHDNWNQTGVDIWDEEHTSTFFASTVQHRALREGARLANTLGLHDFASKYTTQAENILCFMQTFWNAEKSYITSSTSGHRSGIDSSTNLAIIHTFDPQAGCDANSFQPCSDKALANLKVQIDTFRALYPINSKSRRNEAVALGRYPEDDYYGGNAWYLSTFGAAEQLYDALAVWDKQKYIDVTRISKSFFQQFVPNIAAGRYSDKNPKYTALMRQIRNYADGFIAINAKYTPPDGSLSEQFSRENGAALSAQFLTWSYASALSAFDARDAKAVESWGARGLRVLATCESFTPRTTNVKFNLKINPGHGMNFFITGNANVLKNWSTKDAVPLDVNGENLSVTLELPAPMTVRYKFIQKIDGIHTLSATSFEFAVSANSGLIETNNVWNPRRKS